MCRVTNKRERVAGAVYIGRGSKWGNPHRIDGAITRDYVIIAHKRTLAASDALMGSLDELRGRDLECYCAPLACHGDVLLKLANASPERRAAWRARWSAGK